MKLIIHRSAFLPFFLLIRFHIFILKFHLQPSECCIIAKKSYPDKISDKLKPMKIKIKKILANHAFLS